MVRNYPRLNQKPVSDPSSVATAGASSGLREVSPTTDTFVSTSIPTHDHGADSQLPPPQVVQTIPRPPSSASTCQCYPPSVILHAALQHNPFDGCIFQWDISFHPTTHLYQSHKPEEILANKRPVVYPDFLDRHATDPPMRHMFINALGDFPLARCQGDPNPSRSRNKERHMYSSGQGDERVEMRTLPWPIRVVGSSEGSRYITLKDVFRAIHDNFQRYITVEEYGMYTIERKRIIASAYHVREKRLEEVRAWPPLPNTAGRVHSEYSEDLIEEGYMRCDYLGTQLVFRGLEVSPDKEGYTLFLGPSL
ncbi:hypothetical protein P691DRAFT_764000 [Macrolepiota fuliginosa MF-IS2]|uniref:DUF6699 domain-containing protein n=1 Tax=Macrolepiota fuliginosa MF-IS2 TaxID=1400762 RepID=A0A9P5X5T6_9AGAR|nr:hypothetical protein P691DRAFT_764000 [Macrolepiota fuliginosa MF-IS2]